MNKTAIPTNCPQSKSEPVAQAGRLTMVARLLLGGLLGLAVAVSAIMVAESWPTLGARATMVWARLWTVKGIARALFTVGALAGLARLGFWPGMPGSSGCVGLSSTVSKQSTCE